MSNFNNKIVVADDDKAITTAIAMYLRNKGYNVFCAYNGKEAWELIKKHIPFAAILDIKMPGMDGISITKLVKEHSLRTIVVILTAYGGIDNIVPAMKLGAYEFLTKPVDLDCLYKIVKKAENNWKIKHEDYKEEVSPWITTSYGKVKIVAKSKKMHEIFKIVGKIADTDISVLLTGESGTGKEIIAYAIHAASSRKNKPFVAINCTAIPAGLIESEFFGYEKGAFTGATKTKIGKFEAANGGTLFLDEIAEMAPELQPKLLRVLQEGEIYRVGGLKPIKVDVRIISATNQNPEEAVLKGKLRHDLYHRLKGIHIHIPPLRERREDIPELAKIFLQESAKKYRKNVKYISDEVMQLLEEYEWPGNVRELKNLIEAAVVMCNDEILLPEHIPYHFMDGEKRVCGIRDWLVVKVQNEFEKFKRDKEKKYWNVHATIMGELEKQFLEVVLNYCAWNQSMAAKFLGITRNTLRSKIKAYGLDKKKKKQSE